MIVDAHVHIWRATANYPNPSATIVSPFSDVPIDLLADYMDEHFVSRAVLIQPLYPGEDNSYVADCAAAQPEKYAAVCIVDPAKAESPDRLEYWVKERGCKGLRLRPMIADEESAFQSAASLGLWERAAALGIVVNIVARPQHIAAIRQRAEQFPTVPIIVDHMAHPHPDDGIHAESFRTLLNLARFPNVFVKPTGYYYYSGERYPYQDCWEHFRAVFEHFGAARLIWGSDFPHVLLRTGYRRSILMQERVFPFLTPADMALMMGENALRLYWRDERR